MQFAVLPLGDTIYEEVRKVSRRGFTLIELLVVIAIIASNVRQLGIAAHMYAQDYDERFPVDYYACNYQVGSGPLTRARLVNQVMPYVNNFNIMYCPSAPRVALDDIQNTSENQSNKAIGYYYYSFDALPATINPRGQGNWSTWVPWFFIVQRTWGNNTGIMTEQWDDDYWLWSDVFCNPLGTPIHQSSFGSINVAYVGGHVKFQPGQAVNVFR